MYIIYNYNIHEGEIKHKGEDGRYEIIIHDNKNNGEILVWTKLPNEKIFDNIEDAEIYLKNNQPKYKKTKICPNCLAITDEKYEDIGRCYNCKTHFYDDITKYDYLNEEFFEKLLNNEYIIAMKSEFKLKDINGKRVKQYNYGIVTDVFNKLPTIVGKDLLCSYFLINGEISEGNYCTYNDVIFIDKHNPSIDGDVEDMIYRLSF